MPVDSQHKTYTTFADKWYRARAACAGQDEVHNGGVKFLPKLGSQTAEDYKAYKLRATYFNAAGRTLNGLVGMIFRKSPQIEQNGVDDIISDVDLEGNSLETFAQDILREVMLVARFGVLVEYPRVDEAPKTQAEASAKNLRPYASSYPTESIINWKMERINNVMQATMVMLKESASEPVDEYQSKDIDQIRELRLADGQYVQRIFRKDEKTNKYVKFGDDIVPLMNNAPLGFIPFYTFGCEDNDLDLDDAPILPLADLNLAHYRVTADYEHGCHFTGLPMLFIAGITLGEKDSIYLGSQTAIVTDNENAQGKFIEFSGQGLGSLEKNLESKEKQMASIGARMLEQQKTGVESEGAMQMRSNGENSVLAALAVLASSQLSKMLSFMARWAGVQGEVVVNLNTDYMPVGMSAQDLTALVSAWQLGAISPNTLFDNLKRGEIIKDNKEFEEEQAQINNAAPFLPAAPVIAA